MIQIIDKPCWPLEVINVLRKEVSDDYDRITSHPEKFGKTETEMEAMFQPYLNYKKAVLPEILDIFSRYDEVKRYLIAEEKKKYDLLMAVAMTALDNNNLESLDAKLIEDQSYQKRCLAIVLAALLEEDIDLDDSAMLKEFQNPAYVIRRMESLEISDDIKLKYMDLYLNMDSFIKVFYEMMEEMIPCLQKHYYLIEEECRHRIEEISSPMFVEYLKNGSYGVAFEFDEKVIYKVSLNIFQFNSLAFMDMAEGIRNFVLVHVGMYIQELVMEKIKKNLITDSEMTTVCKALGDANRYKMLKLFLKNEKMYLQELAKEIGITPATASHHLTLLIEAELITMLLKEKEKDRKVVYYQANRERLQQLSETFLNMSNMRE